MTFPEFMGGLSDGASVGGFFSNLFFRGRQMRREDNAVRRRVKDMKAAGLNPILAAGNPAQSSPIQVSGPNVGALADARAKAATAEASKAGAAASRKGVQLVDAQINKTNSENIEVGLRNAQHIIRQAQMMYDFTKQQELGLHSAQMGNKLPVFVNLAARLADKLGSNQNVQSMLDALEEEFSADPNRDIFKLEGPNDVGQMSREQRLRMFDKNNDGRLDFREWRSYRDHINSRSRSW